MLEVHNELLEKKNNTIQYTFRYMTITNVNYYYYGIYYEIIRDANSTRANRFSFLANTRISTLNEHLTFQQKVQIHKNK